MRRSCAYVLDDLSHCGADAPRMLLRLVDGSSMALCATHGAEFRRYGLPVEEASAEASPPRVFKEEAVTMPRIEAAAAADLKDAPTPAIFVETPMIALHVEALEQLFEFVDDSGDIAHALDQARTLSRTGSHQKTLDDGSPTAFETYRRMRGLP